MAKCCAFNRVRSVINGTIAIATKTCRFKLEVPALESKSDVSDGICRALGTHGGNWNWKGRRSSVREKR